MLYKKYCILALSILLLSGCHFENVNPTIDEKNMPIIDEKNMPTQVLESSESVTTKPPVLDDTAFPPAEEGENIWQQLTYMDKREMNLFLTQLTFYQFQKFDYHRYFEKDIARLATLHFRGSIPKRFLFYKEKPFDDLYQIPVPQMNRFVENTFGIQFHQLPFPFLEQNGDDFCFHWNDSIFTADNGLPKGAAQVTDVTKNKDGTITVSFDVYQYDGTRLIIAPSEGRENPTEDYETYYSYKGKALLQENVAGEKKTYKLLQYRVVTPKEHIQTPIPQLFVPDTPKEVYINSTNYIQEMKNEIENVPEEADKRKLYEALRVALNKEHYTIMRDNNGNIPFYYLNILVSNSRSLKELGVIEANSENDKMYGQGILDHEFYPPLPDRITHYDGFLSSEERKWIQNYEKEREKEQEKIQAGKKRVEEWMEEMGYSVYYDESLQVDYSALPYLEYTQKMDIIIQSYEGTLTMLIDAYFDPSKSTNEELRRIKVMPKLGY